MATFLFVLGWIAGIFALLFFFAAIGTFFRGIWKALKFEVGEGFLFIIGSVLTIGLTLGAIALSIWLFGLGDEVKKEQEKQKLWEECSYSSFEPCDRLCRTYDDDDCSFMHDYGLKNYENGDYEQAVKFWQTSCSKENGESCANLGVLYENGQSVSENKEQAIEYYKKACNYGELEKGCIFLGNMYRWGEGVSKDYGEAARLYKKACDAGVQKGCERQKDIERISSSSNSSSQQALASSTGSNNGDKIWVKNNCSKTIDILWVRYKRADNGDWYVYYEGGFSPGTSRYIKDDGQNIRAIGDYIEYSTDPMLI